MAVGIGKLGLPSIPIPDLFLAEKISLFPAQQATDRTRTPTPPTSPPPPGLPHPSSVGIAKPTTIPQNVRESYITPVRRGSDPGTFSRTVIEGVASYKSAVQARMFGGGDGYAKSITNPTKGLPSPPQSDTSEGVLTGGNGYGSPARRINPKIVESIQSLRLPWEWELTVYPFGRVPAHCSLFGSVSYFWFGKSSVYPMLT